MNYEQRLLHVTVAAGILFSVIEVMMAIYTNSQAVLMDSIYDGAEAVVLALMVFLVPLLYRPYSERKHMATPAGVLLFVDEGRFSGSCNYWIDRW